MNEDFIQNINKLKDAFDFFDEDKDGYIDKYDIKAFLDKFEFEYKENQIIECLKNINLEHKGKIDYNDFEILMSEDKDMSRQQKFDELYEIFKIFDKNGTQKLKILDFSEVLKKLGNKLLSDQEIQVILESCDIDGDNFIEIQEFIRMMMSEEDYNNSEK